MFRVSISTLLQGRKPGDFIEVMVGEIINPGLFYIQVRRLKIGLLNCLTKSHYVTCVSDYV